AAPDQHEPLRVADLEAGMPADVLLAGPADVLGVDVLGELCADQDGPVLDLLETDVARRLHHAELVRNQVSEALLARHERADLRAPAVPAHPEAGVDLLERGITEPALEAEDVRIGHGVVLVGDEVAAVEEHAEPLRG